MQRKRWRPLSPFIRCVKAYEEETVEIQWRCADQTVFVQRVTIPPKATREAQHQPGLDLPPHTATGTARE